MLSVLSKLLGGADSAPPGAFQESMEGWEPPAIEMPAQAFRPCERYLAPVPILCVLAIATPILLRTVLLICRSAVAGGELISSIHNAKKGRPYWPGYPATEHGFFFERPQRHTCEM